MPRYRLTIAYDGTDFCGWQKQEPLVGEGGEEGEASERSEETGADAQLAYSRRTPMMESVREGRVALRTVQGVVEQAVREVVRERVGVLGASRTDSGVHARGQVAAFSCEPRGEEFEGRALGTGHWALAEGNSGEGKAGAEEVKDVGSMGDAENTIAKEARAPAPKGVGWPLARGVERLKAAINSRLPEDVVVVDAAVVAHAFDPIGDVTSKGYSYTFHVSRERPLWDRRFVHHVWQTRAMDIAAMNIAAAALVGEHDFAAFAAAGHGRLTTVRTVHALAVREERGPDGAQRVRIDISGSGFLWNMVRIVAGTLMQVGLGQRTPADISAALASRERAKTGPTAPASGLCLEWIRYKDVL